MKTSQSGVRVSTKSFGIKGNRIVASRNPYRTYVHNKPLQDITTDSSIDQCQ